MKIAFRLFVVLVLHSFLMGNAHAETAQASFDCGLARSPLEKTICQNPELRQKDIRLADTYHEALLKASVQDQSRQRLQQSERKWLKKLDLLCGLTPPDYLPKALGVDPVKCLSDLYQYRQSQLQYGSQGSKDYYADSVLSDVSRHPFTPKLLSSKDGRICPVVEKAVQKDYLSTMPPHWGALLRNEPLIPGGHWLPEDEGGHFFLVKVDGHKETVLMRAFPAHNITYGFSVFLKNGEPSSDELDAILSGNPWDNEYLNKQGWVSILSEEGVGTSFPFHLLSMGNALYILRDGAQEYNYAEDETRPAVNVAALQQVHKDGTVEPTCVVSAAPLVAVNGGTYVLAHKLENSSGSSPEITAPEGLNTFLQNLNAIDVSGQGHCYGGSMGGWAWAQHANERNHARYIALARPWEKLSRPPGVPSAEETDITDEGEYALAYINSWGLKNLYNYKIYRRIKSSLPDASNALADFYMDRFGMDKDNAKIVAETSLNKILITSLHISSLIDWDKIGEDGLDVTAFQKKYNAGLAKHEEMSGDAIRKAALLGLKEQIKNTPKEQIAALNKGDTPQRWGGPPEHEPILFYGLGDPRMVQSLIDNGADVNAVNWFGKTALMYAAQWDSPEISEVLITAHADVNAATPSDVKQDCNKPIITGRTPIMYAAENGSAPMIEMLIKAGANLKVTDSKGRGLADYLALNQTLSDEERKSIGSEIQ